ncbi:Uncharacterised protein [Mycobacteroides abscessus]|nr:Uncharacterised protein [Mycobacteroides abscessus]
MRPFASYDSPFPDDALTTVTTRPSSTASRSWRSRSISTTLPDPLRGCGVTPSSSAAWVAGPTTPSRERPAAFCRAHTACWVPPPKSPSGAPMK